MTRYRVIKILGDGVKIPIDRQSQGSIKNMFDELLKIEGVKEIMEKYGVIFHES